MLLLSVRGTVYCSLEEVTLSTAVTAENIQKGIKCQQTLKISIFGLSNSNGMNSICDAYDDILHFFNYFIGCNKVLNMQNMLLYNILIHI